MEHKPTSSLRFRASTVRSVDVPVGSLHPNNWIKALMGWAQIATKGERQMGQELIERLFLRKKVYP